MNADPAPDATNRVAPEVKRNRALNRKPVRAAEQIGRQRRIRRDRLATREGSGGSGPRPDERKKGRDDDQGADVGRTPHERERRILTR
jgi:hypothetical protein